MTGPTSLKGARAYLCLNDMQFAMQEVRTQFGQSGAVEARFQTSIGTSTGLRNINRRGRCDGHMPG